jgi:asparagine synthetase B (glutamine-hydrolysing)
MCGIYASISRNDFQTPNDGLKKALCNRGPDCTGEERFKFKGEEHGGPYYISLMSTVLAMRGDFEVAAQPFVDSSSGCSLCWNGEAWKIGSSSVVGNDGRLIFEKLLLASNVSEVVSENAVLRVLRSISGPFAFLYVDMIHGNVYFGRDRLGRRSLLFNFDEDSSSLTLSSIADSTSKAWQEVEADGIYQLTFGAGTRHQSSFNSEALDSLAQTHRHSWEGECSSVRSLIEWLQCADIIH